MKYFAKYLPTKGKIKKETTCLYGDTIVVCQSDEAGRMWMNQPSIYKPVKLYLCSRDIQVGDKAFNENGKTFDVHQHILQLKQEGKEFTNLFKVIGEISPKAIWVTEGMEFEEDDLLQEIVYFSTSTWKNKDWIEKKYGKLLDRFKEKEGIRDEHSRTIDITIYLKKYKIKCPTCKTFH